MELHRIPVAPGDGAGQLEAVVDRAAHEGQEPLWGGAGVLEQARGGPVESDQVVSGHHGARVVEGSLAVGERERMQAQRPRQPKAPGSCLLGLGADSGVGSVELLRAPPLDQRLQGVHAEAPPVGIEGRKRRCPAHVGDPGAGGYRGRYLGDGSVGHAQKHEVAVVLAHRQPPLAQAGSDGRAGPAGGSDHGNGVEHGRSSSLADTGLAHILPLVAGRA